MSTTATFPTHIAYELVDDPNTDVTVIEFPGGELAGAYEARELREELDALVGPELPQRFVIDFGNVRSLDAAAFHEIVSFARNVGRLVVCNMERNVRLEAAMTDLDLHAAFAPNREAAIEEARRGATRGEDETVDYPAMDPEAQEQAGHSSGSGETEASASSRSSGAGAEPEEHGAKNSASGESDASRASRVVAAAKAADQQAGASGENEAAAQPSARAVAIAAGLTVEDFGGRSDAPGG